jgi:hypothetical protein
VGFSDGGLETKELPSEMDRVDQTSCGRGKWVSILMENMATTSVLIRD